MVMRMPWCGKRLDGLGECLGDYYNDTVFK